MTWRAILRLGTQRVPVHLESGALARAAGAVRRAVPARRYFLLTVPRVQRLHASRLARALARGKTRVIVHAIPDGEAQKNEHRLFSVLHAMARSGLHRDDALVAVGGGVVCDLGGLAASLYMRGIPLVQVPTTLLAQVDAALGGKTAVDFAGVKNLVGTFYHPRLLLVDPSVLATLPARQIRSGLAEVVKYGVIRDARLFARLERDLPRALAADAAELSALVRRSLEIKASVVARDEREDGVRAHLNFGHTFGHALEAALGYRGLTHGEAVGYGMVLAARVSRRLSLCGASVPERLEALVRRCGLLRHLPRLPLAEVVRRMQLDKKARAGRLRLVLTRQIGLVTICSNVPRNVIFWALHQLRALSALPR